MLARHTLRGSKQKSVPIPSFTECNRRSRKTRVTIHKGIQRGKLLRLQKTGVESPWFSPADMSIMRGCVVYLAFVLLNYFGVTLAQDGESCSTDDYGDEYCTSTATTSISTAVTFSQTTTVTSALTIPLTTPSVSGTVLIVPTVSTEPFPPNSASQSSSPTANAASSGSRPHTLASGAKVGVGIGVVAAVCLIGTVAWLLWRRFSKHPMGSHGTGATEKNGLNYGTVPRPELDATVAAYRASDTTSNHKGASYQSYRSSTLQADNPGTRRASESRPADELFIPALEQRPAYKPEVYVTNADPQGEPEPKPEAARPDPGRPPLLSIGRVSGEASILPSARSSQDEQHSLASQAQAPRTSTMPGLIEEERKLDEQIAETKRRTDFYRQRDKNRQDPENENGGTERQNGPNESELLGSA